MIPMCRTAFYIDFIFTAWLLPPANLTIKFCNAVDFSQQQKNPSVNSYCTNIALSTLPRRMLSMWHLTSRMNVLCDTGWTHMLRCGWIYAKLVRCYQRWESNCSALVVFWNYTIVCSKHKIVKDRPWQMTGFTFRCSIVFNTSKKTHTQCHGFWEIALKWISQNKECLPKWIFIVLQSIQYSIHIEHQNHLTVPVNNIPIINLFRQFHASSWYFV